MISPEAPPVLTLDRSVGHSTRDQLLNDHLQQLLLDLQIVIPYDVAAAWLGHDDRPSLRVVLPAAATLPSLESARHTIFQATPEPARIADLRSSGAMTDSLRCWLGVPLMLNGRRRGWIELLSTQPNVFSDLDLRRADMIVRHAAQTLAHLEEATELRGRVRIQEGLLRAVEDGLLAPTLHATMQRLLADVAAATHALSAALILPLELTYALNLPRVAPLGPAHNGSLDEETLVSVVARWTSDTASAAAPEVVPDRLLLEMRPEPIAHDAGVLLPFVYHDEALGWLSLRYAPIQSLDVVHTSALPAITRIMTALIAWLREQVQREQQAQQSVRMLVQHAHQTRSGAMSDLLAGLAHELYNPISVMIGMTHLLNRDPSLSEHVRADVGAITTEANRISDFVKRLSNFGQMAGSTKAPLAVNEVVADTIAVVAGLAQQRHIALESRLPAESPMVLGNRAQLQQVCLDLITNALEAVETSDEPIVTIEVACEQQWAIVHISDNGYGIPDDLRDRIFAPGFTTKTAGGTRRGLGIGLPMAQDILQQHWGTITVTSQVWRGSCFTLRLPLI